MSEDEAFIRAIVDSPGDDTPRLVYADWLDERDDPRGPYMRAEREAVATGDVERLRELAAGLDPVWVARVSLSPVGVCVVDAEVSGRGSPVTEADLSAVEQRLGITFPVEYRAFLLNYNGCWLSRVWGVVNGEAIYADYAPHFFPLIPEAAMNPHSLDRHAARHRQWVAEPGNYVGNRVDARIAETFLRYTPIGIAEGDWILLGVREPEVGFVRTFHDINLLSAYYLEPARSPMQSFSEYLARFLWPPMPLPRPQTIEAHEDLPF